MNAQNRALKLLSQFISTKMRSKMENFVFVLKCSSFSAKFESSVELGRAIEILRDTLNKEKFPISNLMLCMESKNADNRLLSRKY